MSPLLFLGLVLTSRRDHHRCSKSAWFKSSLLDMIFTTTEAQAHVLHAGIIHCRKCVSHSVDLAKLKLYRRTDIRLHPDIFWTGVMHAEEKEEN